MVDGCTKSNGEGNGGWGDTKGDLRSYVSNYSDSVMVETRTRSARESSS